MQSPTVKGTDWIEVPIPPGRTSLDVALTLLDVLERDFDAELWEFDPAGTSFTVRIPSDRAAAVAAALPKAT